MHPGDTRAWFESTCWPLVVRARSDQAELERLLRAYWSPIYAFVRRSGHSGHDAADLTQEFLATLLHTMPTGQGILTKADPSRGRFRTFLKAALRNFLIDKRRRATTQRAGGGQSHVSAEASELPDENSSADRAFDRQWAASVLSVTLARVEAACLADGMEDAWDAFSARVLGPLMWRVEPTDLDELATKLDARDSAQVSNMIQTVKRRFRRVLEDVVAETVADPAEAKDELERLQSAWG